QFTCEADTARGNSGGPVRERGTNEVIGDVSHYPLDFVASSTLPDPGGPGGCFVHQTCAPGVAPCVHRFHASAAWNIYSPPIRFDGTRAAGIDFQDGMKVAAHDPLSNHAIVLSRSSRGLELAVTDGSTESPI